VGDCYDNVMAENFFATLECELLDQHRFQTPEEARRAVFESIEDWCNRAVASWPSIMSRPTII
jgi:putative transposase